MRALLLRELRASALWGALLAGFGLVANLDALLFRLPHATTTWALHAFGGSGAWGLGLLEFGMAYAMAQRVVLREAEDGALGALDALPVSRHAVYAAKLSACGLWVLAGALASALANAFYTLGARSSLAPSMQLDAHATMAAASVAVGLAGVSLGAALAPWRHASLAVVGALAAALALVVRVWPAARALDPLQLHVAHLDGGRWALSPASLRAVGTASALLVAVGALRFRRLSRSDVHGDGSAPPRTPRALWVAGAVLTAPLVCLVGLGLGGMAASTERVATRRYVLLAQRDDVDPVRALARDADAHFDPVARYFGAWPALPVTVDATQSLRHLGRAGQASGLAVSLDRQTLFDPPRARQVLTHETAHVLASVVSRWHLALAHRHTKVFNEGLAMALERDLAGGDEPVGELSLAWLWRRGLLRAEMLTDHEALDREHDPDLCYPLGEQWVRAMRDLYGHDAPVRALRAFGRRERGWDLHGDALWREVMLDAGMSHDRVVDRAFARIAETAARRAAELDQVPALTALASLTASALRVDAAAPPPRPGAPTAVTVCRFRDPTDTDTDRYVVQRAPCELARGHFASAVVEVQVGSVLGGAEGARDDVADVVFEPWLAVRVAR